MRGGRPVPTLPLLIALLAVVPGCADQPGLEGPPPDRTLWRVRVDGTGDFSDIQEAVAAASTGDTILVGPGTYSQVHEAVVGGVPRVAVLIVERAVGRDWVTILSEAGPESTAIGDVAVTDYAVAFDNIDDGAISGFEIRGGGNAGVLLFQSDFAFSGNRVTGCTVGIRCDGGRPLVARCTVVGNEVGLVAERALLSTQENRFEANASEGIVLSLSTSATLRGDTLAANGRPIQGGGEGAGLALSESEADAEGLLVWGGHGDGVRLYASRLTLRGSTLAYHLEGTRERPGSGARLSGGSTLAAERVVFAFQRSCAVSRLDGDARLVCSVVWAEYLPEGEPCVAAADSGNVYADPLFCDGPLGVFTVRAGSPCAPENSGGCGPIGAFGPGCS